MSRPKRSLGQNFLVDPNIQRKIVGSLGVGEGDEVLEVGPGRGALTGHLVETGASLTVIELDDELARELADRYGGSAGVRVIHQDVLTVDLPGVFPRWGDVRVVGNIPYNITAPILFKLLGAPRPLEIVFMVQREVAERMLADPGTSEYGALAVGIRTVASVERVMNVGRQGFRPVPRVDSTVVRIRPLVPSPLTPRQSRRVRRLTRVAFQWRRKQLRTTLRKHPEFGLSPEEVEVLESWTGMALVDRPERFAPEGFVTLAAAIARLQAGRGGHAGDEHEI